MFSVCTGSLVSSLIDFYLASDFDFGPKKEGFRSEAGGLTSKLATREVLLHVTICSCGRCTRICWKSCSVKADNLFCIICYELYCLWLLCLSDQQNRMYIFWCISIKKIDVRFSGFLFSSLHNNLFLFNRLNSFSDCRLNKEPPNLTFRKKDKGGLNLTSTVTTTHLDLETVKAICSEYRIHNADITLRYDATADDLIDVIEGSRVYIPCIYVVNKIDQITLEELEILDKLPHYCPIR